MIYRRSLVVRQGTSFASQQADSPVSTLQFRSPVNKSALARVVAQLAVVICLVVLAALNISVKGWTEMEDGVLWAVERQRGRSRASSPRTRRRAAPASSRATFSSGSTRRRFTIQPMSSSSCTRPLRIAPRLHGPAAGAVRVADGPRRGDSVRHALALSRARQRRHVLALCRHGRAAPPAGKPGDAALLLAVRRVLRRADVLVQRPARHARLGLLLGRRGVDAAAAAALRALRARVPRAARQLGAQRRRPHPAAAAVSAGAAARRRPGRDDSARRPTRRRADERPHARRARRAALLRAQPDRRPGDHDARARPRAVGHGAPPAALDRLGHGARRVAVRVRLRAALRARVHAGARDSS